MPWKCTAAGCLILLALVTRTSLAEQRQSELKNVSFAGWCYLWLVWGAELVAFYYTRMYPSTLFSVYVRYLCRGGAWRSMRKQTYFATR